MLTNDTTKGSSGHVSTVWSVPDISEGPQEDFLPWGSSDPFFTVRTRVLLENVLKCYIRMSIVWIGVPANLLCCLVFLKQGLSDRINLLLFWLTVADLNNLLSQLLVMADCYMGDKVQAGNWATMVHSKIGYTNWWTGYVSGALMMIVSVDRCLSVAMPFKAKRLLNYRSMAAAIFLCYVVPLVIIMPRFLVSTVKWRMDPSTNHSLAYEALTPWFKMNIATTMEILNYFILITRPVVLITVIICCVITIVHLRQASQKRQEMVGTAQEKGEGADRRITKMLLFLCFMFVFFAFPDVFNAIAFPIFPEYFVFRRYHNTYIVVVCVVWIASCLNSAVNFFVYVALSSRFQKTLKELCQCRRVVRT